MLFKKKNLCISLVHFWLLQSLIQPTSTLTHGSILYFPAIWTVFTLLRRKSNLLMNKENLLAIFLSCLHSYFLSSYFFKKIAVLAGNLTQSPSWALLMSYNYFAYHFLVLPLKKILKIEITTFPLSFHPLFTKALTNSMKVHVWWIRSTKSVPKCLFRSESDSFANKWTIAKLRSETNFKRNIYKHLLLNLYPF